MQDIDLPITLFHKKLHRNPILCIVCGFSINDIPCIGAFYNFVDRLIAMDDKSRLKVFRKKPTKKYGKGEKMPPKHDGVVERLVNKAIIGRSFPNRPERILQQAFATVVKQSASLGLIDNNIIASGDGTCILTGASSRGKKVCECSHNGNYNCDCPRKFSDPNATWGWDSHNERYFYGYTGYFISTYNTSFKMDLPLYLRIVDAKRHDSISAVVAIMEFQELYPWLKMDTFVSDSASDKYSTYKLLEHLGINAVIALGKTNNGKNKYPGISSYDSDGTPHCAAGYKMVYAGYCKQDRNRLKWRCPCVLGKEERTATCDSCSPSPYGRVCYTKPSWDPRLFTKIPRGSKQWKNIMNERTACERINNRILNDYGVENSKVRGKKRYSFYTMIAAINIHLDAQVKKLKFDGSNIFNNIVNWPNAA